MACYIIDYDLRGDRDYKELYEEIKKYKRAHILESSWAIVTDKSAKEIRDDLLKCIDEDDGLFVLRSGTEAAWHNVLCNNQWLIDNL
ncbi:MAG: Putative SinR-like protein [candidate division WS6 bacterium 34_10]|jgi:hypothetical protein|uniref:Putative SinR-like protein n=1 Tax=candidate division WS6 bacterium 34_10 TaxID=1641389 RepID=A0A101HJ38_9BACT|nr:MAG: Putative SinR-like protein [candidate division WS6 bacterium 34_10]